MNNKSFNIFIILSANILTSCEGYRIVHGVVIDKQTGIALDSVLCKVINKEICAGKYTTSNGKFEVEGPFGGCLSDCPDIIVRFSKDNYKTLSIKNPSDTIFYLTAQKKQH